MALGNCWLWARRKQKQEGGWIAYRESRWWWIIPFFIRGFHCVWFPAECLPKEALGFEPVKHHRKRIVWPFCFNGEIVQGDRDWEAALPENRRRTYGKPVLVALIVAACLAGIIYLDLSIKPIYDGTAFTHIGDAVMCQTWNGQRFCGRVTP